MDIICDKCSYKSNLKNFNPIKESYEEKTQINGEVITKLYSKVNYTCPCCGHVYKGEFEPNGYC